MAFAENCIALFGMESDPSLFAEYTCVLYPQSFCEIVIDNALVFQK